MTNIINIVDKRTEQLNSILFLSELIRDYINGPTETITWITESVDKRVTSLSLDKEFVTVKEGLSSPYSNAHSIELGRKIIINKIQELKDELNVINTELNNAYKQMDNTLETYYTTLKGNVDISTIYNQLKGNSSNRLMEEYFAKTLDATIKLNMIGNNNVTTSEYLGKLANVVPSMIKDVWDHFDTLIQQYKTQTEYLVTKYNLQNFKTDLEIPLNTFTKTDDPEQPTKEPDVIEIINTYINKVESLQVGEGSSGLGKVLESLDNISSLLNEKIEQVSRVLESLSESEFKQFNTMLNNFIELGPKNYEKINNTDEEYKELLDFNLKFIPAQDKIDRYFIIGFYNRYIGTKMIIKVYYQIVMTIAKLIGNGVN